MWPSTPSRPSRRGTPPPGAPRWSGGWPPPCVPGPRRTTSAALDAVAEHYESVRQFWQPAAAAYAATGGLDLDDPRRRAPAEGAAPRSRRGRAERTRG
ncbi:hypothetical protein [Amycolatopsis sp. lyj-109]|uniref:hypothetical protein n=1 Tax=Amycolatopsis sp. lyj-109 TaxID=2789287 RepID=UPI003979D3CE